MLINRYVERDNEHQLTKSYYLHEDIMDLKNASEVLITAGLGFKIEPATWKTSISYQSFVPRKSSGSRLS